MGGLTDEDWLNVLKYNRDENRYEIVVDRDVVWIQDNEKDEEDNEYWTAFDDYGYRLIATIFKHMGIKTTVPRD